MAHPSPARGRIGAAAAALWLAAGAASAEAPLSAIDWLSRSVTVPAEPAALAPVPPAPVDAVQVVPLDALARDAAGTAAPAALGLPRDLWSGTRAADLAALIGAERVDAAPALRELFLALLTTAFDPPADTAPPGAFLMARVDRLLDLGALAEADALLAAAGDDSAEAFRRRFDVALLTGTEDAACAALREAPGIAPTYPVRVFCLARGGDWQAATLTLETARALGEISAEDDALLSRFLDLELADDEAPPAPPARPTPLALRLFEAIGEPLPTTGLPIAFAHADLAPTNGWKARLEAGERLARAGRIAPDVLRALYLERRAAASGGVWDRVRAVARLAEALAAGDAAATATALPAAWAAMQASELELPFAQMFAAEVRGLPLEGGARDTAFRMALLTGDAAGAAALAPAEPEAAFLLQVAAGRPDRTAAAGSLGRAIAAAWADARPAGRPADLLAAGRVGEAVLTAIDRVNAGATGDRRGVTEGLAALRAAGLEAQARAAALELMLLDRRG